MSNIQKNFKMKSQLRHMADGGVVDHMSGKSREQQLREATGQSIPAKAPGPGQPDFRNVQSSVKSTETLQGERPKSALQRLFGMADGGKPPHPRSEYDFATGHGGDVKGPGGPVDDKVGPVMLSNKEYVLPADTVDAIGRENLDAMRAATHDFEETKNATGLAGGTPGIFDKAKDMWSSLRGGAAPAAPAPAPSPAFRPSPAAPNWTTSHGAAAGPAAPPPSPNWSTSPGASAPPPGAPAPATAAAAPKAAGGVGGSILRGLGRLAGGIGGVYGVATGGADIAKNGANVANVGDTLAGGAGLTAALASGVTAPLAGAAATGWGAGRAIGGQLSDDTNNAIGGTVNEIGLMAKKHLGFGWGDENAYVPAADASPLRPPTPAAKPPTNLTPVQDVMGKPAMADERGGKPANGYQGLLENRSGLKNSDPRINGSTSESYNAMADDAIIGSYNGKPMTKAQADARAAGLQTASGYNMGPAKDPMMEMLTSALRGGGGGGGGNSSYKSGADDINARFDALNRDLESRYSSSRAEGNLSKRQLELEGLRARALEGDAQNLSSLRGQDLNASSNAEARRMDAARIAADVMNDRNAQSAATTKAGLEAQAKAEEMRMKGLENQDKTMSGIMEEVRTRFKDDPTTMESMTMRLQSAGPEAIGRIAELHGQEKFTAIADLVKSGEIAQKFDEGQSGLWGSTDSGLPRVTGERDEPEFFSDVINGGSGVGSALGREIKDTLGFDGGVIMDDNNRVAGRAGVYDDSYRARVAENAKKDAERRKKNLRGN